MAPEDFHKILILIIFEEDLFENEYERDFDDWLHDHAGKLRIIPIGHNIEDVDFKNKEVIIRVDGEDAKSGERKSCIIYSDFDGKVRDVEPW